MEDNKILECLLTRRSVKAYKPDMIPDDILEKILKAGTFAPTGRSRQSPIIVAVTDKATRDYLSMLNAAIMGTTSDPFYGAPVVAIVLASRAFPTYIYDGTLVMGNLLNAAHAMGVGSCWIHRAKEMFDSKDGKELLKRWNIEGDYEGIGFCILGYPSEGPREAKPRKEDYIRYIR